MEIILLVESGEKFPQFFRFFRDPGSPGSRIFACLITCFRTFDVVKLQSKVQTSVLGLGVDFVLPLSQQQQQQQQQQEPSPKSYTGSVLKVWNLNWSLTLKTKSCIHFIFSILLKKACHGKVTMLVLYVMVIPDTLYHCITTNYITPTSCTQVLLPTITPTTLHATVHYTPNTHLVSNLVYNS